MAAVATWPARLPAAPLREGYSGDPHQAATRTEMEQGTARKRHLTAAPPAQISLKWRMSAEQFEIFKSFYHFDLREGTGWFNVPLWFGSGMVTVEAQFSERYQAAARGAASVTVTTALTVRELPTMSEEEAATLAELGPTGMLRWPDLLPDTMLRDTVNIDPHQPVLKTDMDNGPVSKRAPFPNSPASTPVSWRMSGSEFEAFKGFYRWLLKNGNAWFSMPIWVGGGFEIVAVQFTDRYAFTPGRALDVLVTADLTLRQLPVLEDGPALLLTSLGEDGLASFAAGIHQFVHVTYPEV